MNRYRLPILVWTLALSANAAAEPITVKSGGAVLAVAFAPNGSLLAYARAVPLPDGHRRGDVVLWDAVRGQEQCVLTGHPGAVGALAFSPDGKLLTSGGSRQWQATPVDEALNVKIWDVGAGRELTTLLGQGDQVTDVAFSPDGKTLATAGIDGTVKLRLVERDWRVRATLKPPTQKTRDEPAFRLAFGPGGHWLAVGLGGGAIEIWDLQSLRMTHRLRAHDVKQHGVAVVVSPQDAALIAVSPDAVQVWDTETFQVRKTFAVPPKAWPAALSADGRLLAVGASKEWDQPAEVIVWDLVDGKRIGALAGFKKSVCALAFSADGKRLACGSYDETVRVWLVKEIGAPSAGDAKP